MGYVLFAPSTPIQLLFHQFILFFNEDKTTLCCSLSLHEKQEGQEWWSGMKLSFMERNSFAAEEPPAHNPQIQQREGAAKLICLISFHNSSFHSINCWLKGRVDGMACLCWVRRDELAAPLKRRREREEELTIQLQFHFFISLAREKRNGVELMGLPRLPAWWTACCFLSSSAASTQKINKFLFFIDCSRRKQRRYLWLICCSWINWFLFSFSSFRRSQWRPAALNPPKERKTKPISSITTPPFIKNQRFLNNGRAACSSTNTFNPIFPFSKKRLELNCVLLVLRGGNTFHIHKDNS